MDGWNDMEPIGGDFPFAPMWIRLRPYATYMARETFDRFGDGPIRGRLVPVSTAKDIQPGTFFKLNVPTFPDPSTGGARGGERVVQALSVSYDPAGPYIEWLDAGPQAQAQSAPTVSLAQSASDPHHTLVATIAAVTSGGTWQLQMAKSATQPSTDSALWYISTEGSTDSLTAYVNRLASGSTHWARVRVSSPQSFRSFWSTPDSTETTDLTGPSGMASSSIDAYSALVSWTNGETDYGVQLLLDQSATCPSSGLQVVAARTAGSNSYRFRGLDEDSTHCAAVRHYDEYGGVSASTSLSIQTTTTRPNAPVPDLELVAGSACT
jgi:hypothetical protein